MPGAIANSTIKTGSVLGLRLVAQTVTLLVIANLFGAASFGTYSGVVALAVLLGTIANIGTQYLVLDAVARGVDARDALQLAIPSTLLGGALLACVFLGATRLFAHTLPLHLSAAVALTELVLQPLLFLSTFERHGRERVATAQMYLVMPLMTRCAIAVVLWLLRVDDPLSLFVYGCLVASLAWLLVATSRGYTRWPVPSEWRGPRPGERKRMLGYAAVGITGNGPTEIDKTLASNLLQPSPAGLYAASTRIVGALTLPVISLVLSSMPRLFRHGANDPREAKPLVELAFLVTLAYGLLIGVVVWVASPLVSWLFGPDYAGIAHAVRLLSFALPGMAVRIAAGGTLTALGHPWTRVGFELTGIASLLLGAIFLSPHFGLTGLIGALILAETTMAILGWILLLRTIRSEKAQAVA